MAVEVTTARVRATADLARLDLRDDEIEPLTEQLQKILGHIAHLEQLDLTHVAPTTHVSPVSAPLREDVPRQDLDPREALAQAPRIEHGGYVVPRFVED